MAGSAARIYAGLASTTTSSMVAATATTLSPHLRPPPRQLRAAGPSPSNIYRLPRGRGRGPRNADLRCRRRLLTARGERPPPDDEEEEEEDPSSSATAAGFDAAVALFNRGEYHACHDVVEDLWYGAEDPARTLLHGVLQCAVGFHHLFNQNHRGAMMELGEGLCKLRKLNLNDDDHPFSRFREEVADVLHFLYRTQKELAACTDYLCLTMDGSPSSYQLLGNFAAGQQLYRLEPADNTDVGASSSVIVFSVSDDRTAQAAPPRVKLPTLHATEQNLTDLQCDYQYT